ncbi:phytoene desaturase family protein [Methylomonas sp. HYX-M1]|uniref:phytoene desaturase family protein n=1 Tax=Methylomonas sp. HYX-M1 TaxID=3139307 RepID=UPI00345BC18F
MPGLTAYLKTTDKTPGGMRGIHTESKQERYDVVVIGAGIGGLSCAALLAKAGKSVLVVERHDRPGGYAHGFKRRGFHFDAGVHLVSGCSARGYANGSTIYRICRAVGIDADGLFIDVPRYGRVVYPDGQFWLHSGEAEYVDALCSRFGSEHAGLLALLRLCRKIAEQSVMADEWLAQGRESSGSPAQALADLFRYRRASLAQVLDEYLVDARLKSACAALWPYLGLPPSRLSFLYWAVMMAGYVYEGGYYCRGSFQQFANALAGAIATHGGEVMLNAGVRRICCESGRADAVVLENGQVIGADAVVSNADALLTAEMLSAGGNDLAAWRDRVAAMQVSLSIFACYLATDRVPPASQLSHEAFFFPSYDHELNYHRSLAGEMTWFSATMPGVSDRSVAPAGGQVMMLTSLCPFQVGRSWREAKPAFQQRLLELAEREFPGLGGRILLVESGSPRTMERYTLNRHGAAYGFAATPEQIGPNRPDVRGAVPGLYHVGHWTRPGGGVAGVSVSAVLAAQAVLERPKLQDFWQALQA